MAYPILTGIVLVEANGAALNNAGQDAGARVENAIVVKQIRLGRLHYPYVSGQAWRRWWREVLYEDFGWNPSPVTVIKQPQQAFTAGDPIAYEEDDLLATWLPAGGRRGAGKLQKQQKVMRTPQLRVAPSVAYPPQKQPARLSLAQCNRARLRALHPEPTT